MTDQQTIQPFSKSILIQAPVSKVWKALTDVSLIKKWILEEEINIKTDWKIGSAILIEGSAHWVYFENKGTVLQFEPGKILRYTHLSSLSRLPDEPGNYSEIEFKLSAMSDQTDLTLSLSNFPTRSIYQHLLFYWNTTLGIIKKFIENNNF